MLAFISWLIGRLQTRAELELEVIAPARDRRHRPSIPFDCFVTRPTEALRSPTGSLDSGALPEQVQSD